MRVLLYIKERNEKSFLNKGKINGRNRVIDNSFTASQLQETVSPLMLS